MNDWKNRGYGLERHRRDESWRGRDRSDERAQYDERHASRTHGYGERDHRADDGWYDREVDDRGFYSRAHGALGWSDRDTFGRDMSLRDDGRDMPRRMMDEGVMARGYRSPAERVGRGQDHDAWRQSDGWQRRSADDRQWSDPGRFTTEPQSSFDGYSPERSQWSPSERLRHASPGKAPKGYVRSDERIREDICDRLASQHHDWSDVEVQVAHGEVTLTGTVSDRRQKLEAEHVADAIRGVTEIHNQIRVKSARHDGEAQRGAASNGEAEPRHRRNVGRS